MPSRPHVASGAAHVTGGALCLLADVVFVLLLLTYPPLFLRTESFGGAGSRVPLLITWPPWRGILFACKVCCGIWNVITGAVGLSVQEESPALGKLYQFLSAFNAGFSAAVIVLNAYFVGYLFVETDLFSTEITLEERQLWLLAFPCAGIALGIFEFVASLCSSRSERPRCWAPTTADSRTAYSADCTEANSDARPTVFATTQSHSESLNAELLRDPLTCKICMDRQVCVTFRPCGHLCVCQECAASFASCPMCRGPIQEKHLTFLS